MPSDNFNPKAYRSDKGHAHIRKVECPILFFDVVGFSKDINNERAKKAVAGMQHAMWDLLEEDYYWAEKKKYATRNSLVLIPTGDGYGIASDPAIGDDRILW